ncbi:hypothetical protein [Sporosarcina highlanderae]|uniref:Uncharacterized protein n=1 Tax=Sporosarcina highlanderae TaxID=3035916 RepID=A0ABT8JVD8_9BACL|nr:hypothetical protein [Sporosarcina highlanderae]MDN4609146.1 hypothetical protein [Sporosarcina highlanderae]
MRYFYIEVKDINQSEVDKRVDDLIGRGFEVHSRSESVETKAIYKRTKSIGRSKAAFDRREDYQRFSVVMRRENVK